MNDRPDRSQSAREQLSALMDGQAQAGEVDSACAQWPADSAARDCWHTYHLIGDVLRSGELAGAPQRDTALLRGLRERLATEPVHLTPAIAASRSLDRYRNRYRAPAFAAAGLAAGVVVVAGVVVMMRTAEPQADAKALAAVAGQPDLVVVNGQLVRDAQLDRYLAAHRKVANGAGMQVPGAGVVRSVDTVVLEGR